MSQYIEHGYKNLSPLFDEIERLYTVTSDVPKQSLIQPVFSDAVKPILDTFTEYYPHERYQTQQKRYEKLKLPNFKKDNLVLCFSGGKDSVAAALHYMKKYNVYLYHMRGINKVYADEWQIAQNLASELGLPIYIDKVSLKGNHRFTEHFMKNMLVANGALHYGINQGISTKIAFGNYYTSWLVDNAFDVAAGDCKDMWQAYEQTIRHIIPKFRMYIPLCNIATSYRTIEKHVELLPKLVSCLGPYRYRDYWKSSVEEKYKIKLMPNRCGRCWKCCAEYIYFTDKNILEFNEAYYKYCLEKLLRTHYAETGIWCYDIYYLWSSYMFYPIEKSKLKEIKNAVVQHGKIKYT